jgi:hypothetical protein
MFAIAFLFIRVLCDCFRSRRRLEAEILVLRHQLNELRQRAPRRLYLTWADRALFVWLYSTLLIARLRMRSCSRARLTVSAPRRFPPPWSIEEHSNACFIVRDGADQPPQRGKLSI